MNQRESLADLAERANAERDERGAELYEWQIRRLPHESRLIHDSVYRRLYFKSFALNLRPISATQKDYPEVVHEPT